MQELDVEKFWADDEAVHKDNCFSQSSVQVALGIRMSDECVFAELGEDGDPWDVLPRQRRIELNKRYNEKAIKIVGRSLLNESYPDEDEIFPRVRKIGEVFKGTYEYKKNAGEWLSSSIKTSKELEKMLDEVDCIDLRKFMFPANWISEKKRIFEKYGKKPSLLRHVRGPVTLAMSIYGEENLIFLYYDSPELFQRFSDTIADVIIKMTEIMDEEAGHSKSDTTEGFSFADDNCQLLTPEMYEEFGYPVLKKVFDRFCPDKSNTRYQHSDSAMGHLLPVLAKLDLTGCNFGPTVLVDEIRKYMPATRIDGCLAPFTFMNNDPQKIIFEVKRDCEMIKASKTKGLNLMTAGSINNGSLLESMRLVMQVIQNYGKYR